jgi:serine/threonine-protein kinase HipA
VYKRVDIVEVRAWNHLVGAVALDPRLGYYAFEYSPAFIKSGIELAPLTMPLSQAQLPFIFPDLSELTYKRLPSMLADALPDDFGNHLINAWMANLGVAAGDITALDRLAYMGKRGLGALEFRPVRGPTTKHTTAIVLSDLVESARRAVHGEFDSDPHAAAALKQILSVGTSAGGARAKATIAWNPATNEIRTGQFDVDPGFEHWLLKFDGIGKDNELGEPQGYGRIEYAYHLMATQAGIAMSPCRLLEEGGRAHFMTKRFDRDGNIKLHTQTLCGMAQLDYKAKGVHDYSQFLGAMRRLKLGTAAFEQAFRRIAFNVMASNCDDHSKNISFMLREGGHWDLAPAYDLIYAYNPKGEWTFQHLISVNGKFNDIGRGDLLTLADRFEIGIASKLLAEVRDAVAAWPQFAATAQVSPAAIDRIRAHQLLL